jgi:hypothetical protein
MTRALINGRVIFIVLSVLSLAPVVSPQEPVSQSSNGEAATALRAMAIKIEKCPEQFVLEKPWGKGRLEIERVYIGPPKNVVWRTTQAEGLPYRTGYIEFVSSFYSRVPVETADKYKRRHRVVAVAEVTGGGVAFAPTLDGFSPPDTEFRYEFDLRPEGLKLVRMVSRSSPSAAWQATATGHPCVAKFSQ